MPNYNTVLLMGNLTRDPELRYTPSGSPVCNLGLAVNRNYTDRAGESREETTFVDIEVWQRQAETCQQYLRKGAPVFVEGRLKMDEWDDRQTGQKRSKLKVLANRVQFLSGPNRAEFDDGGGGGGDEEGGYRGQPQGAPPQGGGYNRGGGGGGGGGYNRGGGQPQGGGGYNRGGGAPAAGGGGDYGRGAPAPRSDNRGAPSPPRQQQDAPPFPPKDARPANPAPADNDAFNVDDDEPIDDIPF